MTQSVAEAARLTRGEVRTAFEAARVTQRQVAAFDLECNCTKAIM